MIVRYRFFCVEIVRDYYADRLVARLERDSDKFLEIQYLRDLAFCFLFRFFRDYGKRHAFHNSSCHDPRVIGYRYFYGAHGLIELRFIKMLELAARFY